MNCNMYRLNMSQTFKKDTEAKEQFRGCNINVGLTPEYYDFSSDFFFLNTLIS